MAKFLRLSGSIQFGLSTSITARILAWPFKNFLQRINLCTYHKSPDAQFVRSFRKKHNGERCFIIGNGPSLRISDLEKLQEKKVITFGANRIYNVYNDTIWRPTYYVATDPYFLSDEIDNIPRCPETTCYFLAMKPWNRSLSSKRSETAIYQYLHFKINRFNDRSAKVSEDVSRSFSNGYTVTFDSIQLAIYMGFSEIYLLGIDFSCSKVADSKGRLILHSDVKNHFYENKKNEVALQCYDNTLFAYQAAKDYCLQKGILICNATRGGKLEVFERVDFDSLF